MAAYSNLFIDQGATFTLSFTVYDDDGLPRNITNFTVRSQMRRSYYSSANTTITATVSNPAEGEVMLDLSATQTTVLKPGRYVYDVELVSTNSLVVERLVEGIITVYPEVTR